MFDYVGPANHPDELIDTCIDQSRRMVRNTSKQEIAQLARFFFGQRRGIQENLTGHGSLLRDSRYGG